MQQHHPHQLFATPFATEADQMRLVGFSCGEETYARYVAEWILGSDVFDRIKKQGNKVWLFETIQGDVIGYGALGITRRKWPKSDDPYLKLVIIPMLGVDSRYIGQPPDPEWRYANQIMAHLIHEATRIIADWPDDAHKFCRKLLLLVHRDNKRAIRFYERCGFEVIPGSDDAIGNLKMIYELSEV